MSDPSYSAKHTESDHTTYSSVPESINANVWQLEAFIGLSDLWWGFLVPCIDWSVFASILSGALYALAYTPVFRLLSRLLHLRSTLV